MFLIFCFVYLAKEFQNKPIDRNLKLLNDANYEMNIDVLPQICFKTTKTHLTIKLNDKNSKTSLFEHGKYKMTIYSLLDDSCNKSIHNNLFKTNVKILETNYINYFSSDDEFFDEIIVPYGNQKYGGKNLLIQVLKINDII